MSDLYCPSCGGPSRVIDSRGIKQENAIRRRRGCNACTARWTTVEVIVPGSCGAKRGYSGGKTALSVAKQVFRDEGEALAKRALREWLGEIE